jgi:hypothetical protein
MRDERRRQRWIRSIVRVMSINFRRNLSRERWIALLDALCRRRSAAAALQAGLAKVIRRYEEATPEPPLPDELTPAGDLSPPIARSGWTAAAMLQAA